MSTVSAQSIGSFAPYIRWLFQHPTELKGTLADFDALGELYAKKDTIGWKEAMPQAWAIYKGLGDKLVAIAGDFPDVSANDVATEEDVVELRAMADAAGFDLPSLIQKIIANWPLIMQIIGLLRSGFLTS